MRSGAKHSANVLFTSKPAHIALIGRLNSCAYRNLWYEPVVPKLQTGKTGGVLRSFALRASHRLSSGHKLTWRSALLMSAFASTAVKACTSKFMECRRPSFRLRPAQMSCYESQVGRVAERGPGCPRMMDNMKTLSVCALTGFC